MENAAVVRPRRPGPGERALETGAHCAFCGNSCRRPFGLVGSNAVPVAGPCRPSHAVQVLASLPSPARSLEQRLVVVAQNPEPVRQVLRVLKRSVNLEPLTEERRAQLRA